jgi:hypothetical protein
MVIKPTIGRWHDRLRHPSMIIVSRIVQENNLPCSSLEFNKEYVCGACQHAKSHQLLFPKSFSTSQAPLELVHSNVWGPPPTYVGRKNYCMSFVDDFSKFIWIYLIRHKSKVFSIFQIIQSLVEHTFNKKMLAMQMDWGGEYQKLVTPSLLVYEYPIMFLAHIQINKMMLLNENIDIL